jgi:allantoate deiminase
MTSVNKARIEADLRAINTYNATPGKGVTRLTFSPEWIAARRYVIDEMEKIGCVMSCLPGGNLRCRLPGSNESLPPVMAGSHLDTVTHGGHFDGTAGVVAAMETARVLCETAGSLRRPFDVVVFPEEEGTRFGSVMLGSRVWTGKVTMDELSRYRDGNGVTYLQAMTEASIAPDDGDILETGSFHAALELHIEQSVVLEKRGLSLGIVEAIAGIKQLELTLLGVPNHAGGTPMAIRADALAGAAEITCQVERIAMVEAGSHTVATVGRMEVEPGQANVIAGLVRFTVDVRDPDSSVLSRTADRILSETADICEKRGLEYVVRGLSDTPPAKLSPEVVGRIRDAAAAMDFETMMMVSGALHDSSVLAAIGDVGMIFVPSKDGRSHCPEEETDLVDIVKGADLLANTVMGLVS